VTLRHPSSPHDRVGCSLLSSDQPRLDLSSKGQSEDDRDRAFVEIVYLCLVDSDRRRASCAELSDLYERRRVTSELTILLGRSERQRRQ